MCNVCWASVYSNYTDLELRGEEAVVSSKQMWLQAEQESGEVIDCVSVDSKILYPVFHSGGIWIIFGIFGTKLPVNKVNKVKPFSWGEVIVFQDVP